LCRAGASSVGRLSLWVAANIAMRQPTQPACELLLLDQRSNQAMTADCQAADEALKTMWALR
jgi:hypothetical protein